MTPWRTLAVGLAAWRVASLLAYERGPYALVDRLRAQFPTRAVVVLTQQGARKATDADPLDDHTVIALAGARAEVGRALDCPYCTSLWLAGLFAAAERHAWGRQLTDVAAAAAVGQVLLDLANVASEALDLREAGGAERGAPD